MQPASGFSKEDLRDDLDAGKRSQKAKYHLWGEPNLIVPQGTRLIAGSNGKKLGPMGAIRRRVGRGFVNGNPTVSTTGKASVRAFFVSGLRYSLFPG